MKQQHMNINNPSRFFSLLMCNKWMNNTLKYVSEMMYYKNNRKKYNLHFNTGSAILQCRWNDLCDQQSAIVLRCITT